MEKLDLNGVVLRSPKQLAHDVYLAITEFNELNRLALDSYFSEAKEINKNITSSEKLSESRKLNRSKLKEVQDQILDMLSNKYNLKTSTISKIVEL